MRDNDDGDPQASSAEDTEAERHELAELVGKLLAWDWLEQRREAKQASAVKPTVADDAPRGARRRGGAL